MQGFITDADLEQADEEFPGIRRFFAMLAHKPSTFLELLAEFDHWAPSCADFAHSRSPVVTTSECSQRQVA
jgi:hypothetical protein